MTFKQVSELGAHVRNDETGTLIVYADKIIRKETNSDAGDEAERRNSLQERRYGLHYSRLKLASALLRPAGAADRSCRAHRPCGRVPRGRRQCHPRRKLRLLFTFDRQYSYALHRLLSRRRELLRLAHECTHWMKHEKRLNFGCKRFGNKSYARDILPSSELCFSSPT